MENMRTMLQGLTHDDLLEWAGSKIFERGRSCVSRVAQLSQTEDDGLAAWVSGTRRYATWVSRDSDGFDYECTCPYDWGPCKHAVAVLFKAAEQIKKKQKIPFLDAQSDLYLTLFEGFEGWEESLKDIEDQENVFSLSSGRDKSKNRVEYILAQKSREELLTLLVDLADRHPAVKSSIVEAEQMARGDVNKIVRSLRSEIDDLTAEPAYYNPWDDEENPPDFSHVREQLQELLKYGHAEAVLQVGEDLWKQGRELVEMSHDDGETGVEISECMDIVLKALLKSPLTPPQQILWIIGKILEDDYDLLRGSEKILNNPDYIADQWRDVAAELDSRLQAMPKPKPDDYSSIHQRREMVDWLIQAYQSGDQPEKIIPLLEKEVQYCQNYTTLVDALLAAGERESARKWCVRGFNKTVKRAPGIAAELQERLREMAQEEEDFSLVAAYRAADFFYRPGRQTYLDLRKASQFINKWPIIRNLVLNYLQTGVRPDFGEKRDRTWPLPEPEVQRSQDQSKHVPNRFPDIRLLMDIAILEERNYDVVSLYNELRKKDHWYGETTDNSVAQAVAASHPHVALQIWEKIVDNLIAQVKPKAYQEAAVYLRRMRVVYEQTCSLEKGRKYIHQLRVTHKAKRRLMEVLDNLEKNKKLLD